MRAIGTKTYFSINDVPRVILALQRAYKDVLLEPRVGVLVSASQ